ncbi:MAG TPA: RidA family protein [Ignavibacteria bacterium]|nr:RidA family protein [Ignavibacteria bacterium]HMQ98536.1 RidA family protein [Ignavibacteria bacterium]
MEIKKISSGAKWESIVGYSRAIRAGNRVMVTGTTSVDENGGIVGVGNAYEQTKYIFQKIEKYLKETGSSLENVVWNRMYVTDISKWEDIGRAHAEFFKDIKPCATMVEVKGFIHPDMMVEIETEAVCD